MEKFLLGACAGLNAGTGISYILMVHYAKQKFQQEKDKLLHEVDEAKKDAYKKVDDLYFKWREIR